MEEAKIFYICLSDVDPLLNQNNDDGNTPLHLATLSKHVEVVELLIQNEGVNVGLLNKEGLMAHDLAKELTFVDDTSKRVVMRLNLMLEKATNDIKLFPIDGNLYLHLAKREINRVSESVRRLQLKDLLTPDEGENVLHIAACMDSTQLIHDLLQGHGCTTLMYQANKKGDLPIHSAVKVGNFQSLKGLFQWSPSIPSDHICIRPNFDGNTALHVAVLYNRRKDQNVIKLFHHRHLLNSKDQNVLHVAAKNYDNHYIIAYLHKRKFKELINTTDDNGNTPLHLAVKGFHLRAVYRLLKYQHIKGNLKNKELQTPLDIFIMHMKCADKKGLSSLQIHLMEVMLNKVNERTLFSKFTRRDDLEVEEKLREVEATKKICNPPGGYNDQTGLPNLVLDPSFQSFVSENSSALVYGIISAIILILGMHIDEFTGISLIFGGLYIFIGLFLYGIFIPKCVNAIYC
ncbi:protein ACCELERATED CELL DEATH 6-like [Chenopodium quinoa]|uniref:protein ACCELERATED CELL DEATH 6-like n=1 Tax=Chenopodium quinoa TaxID=63459 RepID=UPI000B771ADA|nr:protein ACCELERATED CELL DEATH 6-like [Chenopodium quinoa]